jgi:hypothetical protein
VFRLEVEVLEWDVPVEVEAPDVEPEANGA